MAMALRALWLAWVGTGGHGSRWLAGGQSHSGISQMPSRKSSDSLLSSLLALSTLMDPLVERERFCRE